MNSIKAILMAHKIPSFVALALLVSGGYWAYSTYASTDSEARYVLGTVAKGTIVASVSASGQVAASDEADIKAKAAGEITSLTVKAGQRVKQGQILGYIDSTEARRAVTDAELAVEEAKINLEHDTLQAPLDYKSLQEDVERAKRDLEDAYDDGYVALSDAYTKLPDVVTGADSILYDYDISQNSQNIAAYKNLFINTTGNDGPTVNTLATRAEDDYKAARDAYTKASATFRALPRASKPDDIAAAVTASKDAAALLAKAVASEGNLIDTVIDILDRRDWNINTGITSSQTSVRSYITSANGVLSSLSTAEKSSQTAKDAVTDAEQALELATVGNPTGNNPFDLKLLQNTLKQKEAALLDARQALNDHAIIAPFSGIMATLDARRGDTVANGGAIGTLISDQKISELSLNEVDVAQIQIGDKVTLTFDAVENLSLTGEVAEIDSVGTITQGVVSYTVKVGFDTQDERIKPGMTVNASIQTEVKQDVLMVPSSAVKTQNNATYAQVFNPALQDIGGTQGVVSPVAPQQVQVQTGISDDVHIEIVSGLTEGQQIVARTISGTAGTTATAGSSNRGGFSGPPGAIRF